MTGLMGLSSRLLEPRAWLHAALAAAAAVGTAILEQPSVNPAHIPIVFSAILLLTRAVGALIATQPPERRRSLREQLALVKRETDLLTRRLHKMNNDMAALLGETELLELKFEQARERKENQL